MTIEIANEIQLEQDHGRQKYGFNCLDYAHDDAHSDEIWYQCIQDHNSRAIHTTPCERRQHLIKVAGLAISAVEAFDRKQKR